MWIVIGGGMLMLLIAAIGKQKRELCKDYSINIKGAQKNLFVDKSSIEKILQFAGNGKIKGQRRSVFNLLDVERMLENNVWIKDAEVYFDNHDVLHVSVTEREPVARVFTTSGKSFYVDETDKMMPLSDRFSAKVPVFTGFPSQVISQRDSALLKDVRTTASFILHDPFWMSQVSQLDITPARTFEMIPVVGNHIVLLGEGDNMKQKFHRLFVFYKDVLSQTGFEKYKAINVQYEGQVIGVKSDNPKSDTAQLRHNVEKLLQQAREMQNDSLMAARELKEQKAIKVDPAIAATEKVVAGDDTKDPKAESLISPVPMKPFSDEKNNGKPKAVMPRRSQ
jgi:cell division protein FtsQ